MQIEQAKFERLSTSIFNILTKGELKVYDETQSEHVEGTLSGNQASDLTFLIKEAVKKDLGLGEDKDSISISWHIDDVKEIAPDLTDDQCREVLQNADNDHDATIGVNWDVLEYHVDEVREEHGLPDPDEDEEEEKE